MKIKFRNTGIRVVYKVERVNGAMKIIVISARTDEQVYKEAAKRRTNMAYNRIYRVDKQETATLKSESSDISV